MLLSAAVVSESGSTAKETWVKENPSATSFRLQRRLLPTRNPLRDHRFIIRGSRSENRGTLRSTGHRGPCNSGSSGIHEANALIH
ncbi:hypothetical protein [Methanothermobacter wolfeii]|uniref:hypothetical protein n=1 Tax=Methanothermobacter wolfeii TaxID=145261 RepID=UPI0024B38B49|nr:hypothetical protein [Methanothermobacter wolfeii]MDI6702006.1 hypothetical protein [Methanothermobacter wolfeii]